MAQSQRAGTGTGDRQSLVRRVFGVGFRRDTYANLAYLLARFPLGIAYFTIFVTGLSLGFGLIPVIIGVPILAGVLALAGYVGVVEADLLSRLYGRDVSYDVPDPGEQSMTEYLKTVATTPRNYLLVLFALGSFAVGVPLFVVITVVFTLSLTLVVAPLFYWMPGANYDLTQAAGTVDVGPVAIDAGSFAGASINTLPEALVASVLGVVVCLVGFHAVNLTAWGFSTLTQRLLGVTAE